MIRLDDLAIDGRGALRLLSALSPDPLFLHDLDGIVQEANPAACGLLGYPAHELVGLPLESLLHPDCHARVRGHWATVCEVRAASPAADGLEATQRRRDGTACPVTLTLRRLEVRDGSYVLVNARDLSEEQRVRRELERHRDDLQLILDAMPAFVFYKDVQNRILRANRAAARSHGVHPDEMANTDTARWYPEEAERYYADDLEVIQSGRPKLGIVEPLATSGEKRWIMTDKLPQLDAEGLVHGIVVIAQDITERRKLEQQLLEAHKLDSIGRLAGGVAHDFNNLLTAVLGHVELAQTRLERGECVEEHLDAIRIAAERGADLGRQLLAFARRQVIEPRVVDMNELVREAERLLGRVIGANIELVVTPAAGRAPVRVDPGQITQVILNMALNARDAMPDGGRLTLKVDPDEGAGARLRDGEPPNERFVRLTVKDSGQGISEEVRPRLFEPFFTTKPRGQGTGLGLATSYGIVRQSGGHIAVTSAPGAGTTFEIYLPRAAHLPEVGVLTRAEGACPTPKEATILVAEDDEALRSLTTALLRREGYRVIEASDGEEACRRAREEPGPVHLLLTDLTMPKVGGMALSARVLRERPTTKIMFMSGRVDDALASELAGSDRPLLQKPFTPAQLLTLVADTLATRR